MAPIDIKQLEEEGEEVGTGPRENRASQVLAFLKKNATAAFTQAEVAKAIGIGKTHANQVLKTMCENKLVHRRLVTGDNGRQLIYYSIVSKKDK
jgi:response regulator of citrate/malate metabolism